MAGEMTRHGGQAGNGSLLQRTSPLRWSALVFFIAALILWEALVRLGTPTAVTFPPPSFILSGAAKLIGSGELPKALGITFGRLALGFLLGAVPGFLLGLAMGWSRRARAAFDPLIAALHPTPKMSLYPILLVMLGISEWPKLVVIALGAFFPMLINSMAGVRQISPIHFEVAENFGAGRLRAFGHVVLPGSLAMTLAGVRLAFNTALHITLAVEMLSPSNGLGKMIWFSWETMRTEQLYAVVGVTVLIGVVFNALLRRATLRLVPWQIEHKT